MIRNVHLIYTLSMDDLHNILTNGVIAGSVPGFVATDARNMKIDTCVPGLVLGLVCKAENGRVHSTRKCF
ncbi:hypothetical protein BDV09DRAFT_164041 [Aspergillus tetrazonus]